MTGNERQQFCDKCSCSVHNLTGMDHQQIMDLRSDLGGKLCGAFYQQSQTDTPGQRKKKIRRVHLRKSLVLGASISTLALAACQSEKDSVLLGECVSVQAPDSETSREVIKGETDSEKEAESPEIDPRILGKIYCPKHSKE